MSRLYEMRVSIKGYDKAKDEEIAKAAQKIWPWQGGLTLPRHTVNPNTGNPPGNEIYGLAQDNLCGGETEEQFARRLTKAIFAANKKPCKVQVEAVYLEDPPSSDFNFDDENLP